MKHEQKLRCSYNHFHEGKSFEEWLIQESERNHKKSVTMAGDLGEAFAKIGKLEAESKIQNQIAQIYGEFTANCVKGMKPLLSFEGFLELREEREKYNSELKK